MAYGAMGCIPSNLGTVGMAAEDGPCLDRQFVYLESTVDAKCQISWLTRATTRGCTSGTSSAAHHEQFIEKRSADPGARG